MEDNKLIWLDSIGESKELLREINQDDKTPKKKSKANELFEVTNPEDIEFFGDPSVLNEF
jgi:hypothetical protein